MEAILILLKPLWGKIAGLGAAFLGIALVWFKAKESGIQAVERKSAMETLKAVQTRDKIENNIDSTNLDKLHKKWERD